MEKKDPKKKALALVKRCEYYLYKYLLTKEKVYIDRLFSTTKRLKKLILKHTDEFD